MNLPRLDSTNNDHPSMRKLTKDTFYVNEFIDMIKEIKEKEIFKELIYGISLLV